jgi:hypothetical protein
MVYRLLPLLLLSSSLAYAAAPAKFVSTINPISETQQKYMKSYTWHTGCPLSLNEMAYVQVSYWGFDKKSHLGVLVVNRKVAPEVVDIFKEIYAQHFAINRMLPMEAFEGDDNHAMMANNTSAFNCRMVTGKTNMYSMHSYGLALDINTLINPYVKNGKVSPTTGKQYLDRNKPVEGMIVKGDPVYNAFIKRGWTWGGDWTTLQDYQHFEKPTAI